LAIFGFQFRGIETELGPFERLAKFYQGIDTHFNHPRKKTLRAFLREADLTELELLPAIPAVKVVITYDTMQERIQAAEAEIRNLEAAIAALGPYLHVFVDPRSVEPGDLPRLVEVMRSLIDEEAALDRCEEARNIFEGVFAGSRTANDTLSATVAWACATEGSREVHLAILSADKTSEAREQISHVLSAERLAEELLSRVTTTAKINARHFTKGSYKEIAQRLDDAGKDKDGLFSHSFFATALDEVRAQGLLPLVDERIKKDAHLQGLAEQLEAIAVRQLSKAVYADVGSELSKYRGSKLDDLRKSVAQLDREIIRLSRKQLRTNVRAAARPPQRERSWSKIYMDRIGANRERN
jgi:hypothetical protein